MVPSVCEGLCGPDTTLSTLLEIIIPSSQQLYDTDTILVTALEMKNKEAKQFTQGLQPVSDGSRILIPDRSIRHMASWTSYM